MIKTKYIDAKKALAPVPKVAPTPVTAKSTIPANLWKILTRGILKDDYAFMAYYPEEKTLITTDLKIMKRIDIVLDAPHFQIIASKLPTLKGDVLVGGQKQDITFNRVSVKGDKEPRQAHSMTRLFLENPVYDIPLPSKELKRVLKHFHGELSLVAKDGVLTLLADDASPLKAEILYEGRDFEISLGAEYTKHLTDIKNIKLSIRETTEPIHFKGDDIYGVLMPVVVAHPFIMEDKREMLLTTFSRKEMLNLLKSFVENIKRSGAGEKDLTFTNKEIISWDTSVRVSHSMGNLDNSSAPYNTMNYNELKSFLTALSAKSDKVELWMGSDKYYYLYSSDENVLKKMSFYLGTPFDPTYVTAYTARVLLSASTHQKKSMKINYEDGVITVTTAVSIRQFHQNLEVEPFKIDRTNIKRSISDGVSFRKEEDPYSGVVSFFVNGGKMDNYHVEDPLPKERLQGYINRITWTNPIPITKEDRRSVAKSKDEFYMLHGAKIPTNQLKDVFKIKEVSMYLYSEDNDMVGFKGDGFTIIIVKVVDEHEYGIDPNGDISEQLHAAAIDYRNDSSYENARKVGDLMNIEYDIAISHYAPFVGEDGLVKDEYRRDEAYRKVYNIAEKKMKALQKFNKAYVKKFKKEIRDGDRKERIERVRGISKLTDEIIANLKGKV